MNSKKGQRIMPDFEPVEMSARPKAQRALAIAVSVFMMLLIVSCGNWGWESIDTDNEERLNVFGLISLDETVESFVVVHRTLDTAGPLDVLVGRDTVYFDTWEYFDEDQGVTVRDTFWYDPPWIRYIYETRYVVKDATVLVSDGTQEYVFERAPVATQGQEYWNSYLDIFNDPAIYRNVDGTFVPQGDTEYYLSIETPSGLSTTGMTRTPPLPQIKEQLLPDTVSVRGLFEVEWKYAGDYTATVATGNEGSDYSTWICGLEQWSSLEPGDTTWVSSIDTWCFEEGLPDNEDVSKSMKLRVRFLDENYYGYFLERGDLAEISNILLGEGGIAHGFGVDDGFGVFGSFSADWTQRIAKP